MILRASRSKTKRWQRLTATSLLLIVADAKARGKTAARVARERSYDARQRQRLNAGRRVLAHATAEAHNYVLDARRKTNAHKLFEP